MNDSYAFTPILYKEEAGVGKGKKSAYNEALITIGGASVPPTSFRTPRLSIPGYAPRWLAAQAIADALDAGKRLDERLAWGHDEASARDKALAHSIATMSTLAN